MKIKLNTVKSKVVAGVAAVTLLSGAGFVAANTDAGTQLQGWYNKAYSTVAIELGLETGKHGATKLGEFAEHSVAEGKDAVNSINSTKEQEKEAKTKSINDAKQSHIDAVKAKEATIAAYMDDQFDQIAKLKIDTFNFTSNGAYNLAALGLGATTKATGDAAFKALEKELNAEKEKAVSELDQTIVTTKETLLAQLQSEKNGTTEEIKEAIDSKIATLKQEITAKKNTLVAAQQSKLVAKANEIEGAAKAELDQLVADINKK